MGKSNLLKDAIADAKAVRETALANARMRMEEAFTPRLQSMISAKLQNEVEGEDDEEEVVVDPEVEVPVEEPVAAEPELELPAEPEVPVAEPEIPVEEPVAVDGEDLDIEVEPEVEPGFEDEVEDEVEEEGYELDLESIIKELEAETDMEDDIEEPMFESDDKDEDDEEKEELEEGDGMQNTAQDGSKDTDKGMKTDKDVTAPLTGKTGPNPGVNQDSPDRGKPFSTEKGGELTPAATLKQKPENAIYENEDEDEDDNEEINLDEILRELEEADLSASVPDEIPDGSNPFKTMNEQLQGKVGKLSKDLKEHRQVIKFLKSKLNEVNLLNAKLLFTSKLFKSNNLSNSQKMKVIENFDRAKTLREVKLVYSTIAESFGSTKNEQSKKSVKNITEQISGGASKPVASTKPTKKVINEGAIVSEDGAERLKKLAGIKVKK